MKPWFSCALTFGAVFAVGMLWQVAVAHQPQTRPASARQTPVASRPPTAPLPVPPQARADSARTPGWEQSGILDENFVSARYRLTNWFRRQRWASAKTIVLDETRNLREIAVFTRQNYELIVMIWKISTDQTGFSCRREPLKPLNQELLP